MSTKSEKNVSSDQSRKWFIDTFAPASQLESRLIPDILDVNESACKDAEFTTGLTDKLLKSVSKRFGCTEDILLDTAFGLTLSVWTGDTKACFSSFSGDAPVHPEGALIRHRRRQIQEDEQHICVS